MRRSPLLRPAFRVLLLAATAALGLTAAGAGATARESGHSRETAQTARVQARDHAARRLARASAAVPVTRRSRCARVAPVPGQGRSCRTSDGMFLVPLAGGGVASTHGPDLVDPAEAPARTRSGTSRSAGSGTAASVVCSSPRRSRHVVLAYLLPSDYASTSPLVHGDRFETVQEELRQALYDAAAVVDARAGQLVPGARRRIRVLCDPDGRPAVQRVVLRHTAEQLRGVDGGFSMFLDDLAAAGQLGSHRAFASARVPAVRRVLAYYDADFEDGFAGQGTMYRRSSLLRQGMSPADPLLGRTTRNINNNPPAVPVAIQYGTRTGGMIDPPLSTSLLHEFSHTMGAVQDEPPTASDAGHCLDGLDIMCYDDGGPGGTYADTACPDPLPPLEPSDEAFDCNGDTYFHPSPPAGHPLARATTWHLGLPANEGLSADTAAVPAPPRVEGLQVRGIGTRLALHWKALPPARGRSYEVWGRPAGLRWQLLMSTTAAPAMPPLRPHTSWELAVVGVDANGDAGSGAIVTRRTGVDNSPPAAAGVRIRAFDVRRASVRLRWSHALDNVRTTSYRVERLVGSRWSLVRLVHAGRRRAGVESPALGGLRPRTRYRFRVVALDARGNRSAPSRATPVTTLR